MPKKRKNWELESETPVLNSPDCYYFREGGRVFISDSIGETPRVSPIKYTDAMLKQIIEEWLIPNDLEKTGWEFWHPIIGQLVGILELSDEERIEHYRRFRETQLGKIKKNSKVLERLEKKIRSTLNLILSDEVRLPKLAHAIENAVHEEIQRSESYYEKLKNWLEPTARGEHKLLEGKLMPLIEALDDSGLNQDQQARALCDLLRLFRYSDFKILTRFPGLQPSRWSDEEKQFIGRAEAMILRSHKHYRKVLGATEN
ncbi:hypothetical protein ACFL6E_05140 [Candidatus Neomarinimicrobiota bacterium]